MLKRRGKTGKTGEEGARGRRVDEKRQPLSITVTLCICVYGKEYTLEDLKSKESHKMSSRMRKKLLNLSYIDARGEGKRLTIAETEENRRKKGEKRRKVCQEFCYFMRVVREFGTVFVFCLRGKILFVDDDD